MKKLKIIFAGTSYFSEAYLNALIHSSYKIIAIITQPDRKSGRGQKIHFSPVKKISIKYSIPLLQPLTLKTKEIQDILYNLKADIMIVISYGQIIPEIIINMFPMGCINVHPSLLPRWRGPTPIQSAIAYGDEITGINIIQMNKQIDAGQIIYSEQCKILPLDTTATLSKKLIKIGVPALLNTIYNIIHKKIKKYKQDEKNILLSKKIHKKDALLNWNMPAEKIEKIIRAFNPWPICYFLIKKYHVKVWQANIIHKNNKNCNIGEILDINKNGMQINTYKKILNIQKLQLPGKKITNIQDLLIMKKKIFVPGMIL